MRHSYFSTGRGKICRHCGKKAPASGPCKGEHLIKGRWLMCCRKCGITEGFDKTPCNGSHDIHLINNVKKVCRKCGRKDDFAKPCTGDGLAHLKPAAFICAFLKKNGKSSLIKLYKARLKLLEDHKEVVTESMKEFSEVLEKTPAAYRYIGRTWIHEKHLPLARQDLDEISDWCAKRVLKAGSIETTELWQSLKKEYPKLTVLLLSDILRRRSDIKVNRGMVYGPNRPVRKKAAKRRRRPRPTSTPPMLIFDRIMEVVSPSTKPMTHEEIAEATSLKKSVVISALNRENYKGLVVFRDYSVCSRELFTVQREKKAQILKMVNRYLSLDGPPTSHIVLHRKVKKALPKFKFTRHLLLTPENLWAFLSKEEGFHCNNDGLIARRLGVYDRKAGRLIDDLVLHLLAGFVYATSNELTKILDTKYEYSKWSLVDPLKRCIKSGQILRLPFGFEVKGSDAYCLADNADEDILHAMLEQRETVLEQFSINLLRRAEPRCLRLMTRFALSTDYMNIAKKAYGYLIGHKNNTVRGRKKDRRSLGKEIRLHKFSPEEESSSIKHSYLFFKGKKVCRRCGAEAGKSPYYSGLKASASDSCRGNHLLREVQKRLICQRCGRSKDFAKPCDGDEQDAELAQLGTADFIAAFLERKQESSTLLKLFRARVKLVEKYTDKAPESKEEFTAILKETPAAYRFGHRSWVHEKYLPLAKWAIAKISHWCARKVLTAGGPISTKRLWGQLKGKYPKLNVYLLEDILSRRSDIMGMGTHSAFRPYAPPSERNDYYENIIEMITQSKKLLSAAEIAKEVSIGEKAVKAALNRDRDKGYWVLRDFQVVPPALIGLSEKMRQHLIKSACKHLELDGPPTSHIALQKQMMKSRPKPQFPHLPFEPEYLWGFLSHQNGFQCDRDGFIARRSKIDKNKRLIDDLIVHLVTKLRHATSAQICDILYDQYGYEKRKIYYPFRRSFDSGRILQFPIGRIYCAADITDDEIYAIMVKIKDGHIFGRYSNVLERAEPRYLRLYIRLAVSYEQTSFAKDAYSRLIRHKDNPIAARKKDKKKFGYVMGLES